jgi:hypothetical protein
MLYILVFLAKECLGNLLFLFEYLSFLWSLVFWANLSFLQLLISTDNAFGDLFWVFLIGIAWRTIGMKFFNLTEIRSM